MTDALWRLAWALPLVLAVGVIAVLAIRRWGMWQGVGVGAARLRVVESMPVSDETRIHLILVDRQPLLLIESARQVTTRELGSSQRSTPGPSSRWRPPLTPSWAEAETK